MVYSILLKLLCGAWHALPFPLKCNILNIEATVGQWLWRRNCKQRALAQPPLVPVWDIDGSRKGIRTKLLQCASKMRAPCRTFTEPLNKRVNGVEFGRRTNNRLNLQKRCFLLLLPVGDSYVAVSGRTNKHDGGAESTVYSGVPVVSRRSTVCP